MTVDEKVAFLQGTEFAMDWNLYVPKSDIELYHKLLEEEYSEGGLKDD